jgi:hypothetical protein
LFWTIPVSPSSVQVDLTQASARFQETNLAVEDYGTLATAIFAGGPSVPATVSFDLHWQMLAAPDVTHFKVRDAAQGFAGEFWESETAGAATLAWSASEAGFAFASDPAATSSSYFAELGHERNGVFFPQGSALTARRAVTYARVPKGLTD